VVEGFDVPHTHIKLFPVYGDKGLEIKSGEELKDEEAKEILERLSDFL
jgi:diadenosine tetraphosphate (Ap4A) HIT family hydrolase